MSLAPYYKKRDFARTPEPRGRRPAPGGAGTFIIHKHAARRLHYDLRLELDGVLKSWAVPRGPSLDPRDRRLAVHVEDHPLEYGAFEGTIPQGEYGGGTVVLWDRGRWRPEDDDPAAAYHGGKLKFHLDGEKLHGGFTLVRMHSRRDERKDNWLLIKENDAEATDDGERLLRARPESVASGRTLEQVAAGVPAKTTTEPARKTATRTTAKKTAARTATKPATKTATNAAAANKTAARKKAAANKTAANKTAARKPAAKKAAANKTATNEPATKTATNKPATNKATRAPAATKSATKDAATNKPATKAATKKATNKPAATKAATKNAATNKPATKAATKNRATNKPAAKNAATKNRATNKPPTKTATRAPAAAKSAAKNAATKTAAARKAATKTPATKAATKKAATSKPATKAANKPGANKRAANKSAAGSAMERGGGRPLPDRVAPALATLVDALPTGDGWLHEIKFDGYRLLARIDHDDVRLITRGDQDWTERLAPLAEALRERLGDHRALVDGELVHLDADGITRMGPLQRALADQQVGRLAFFAFDLLHLDGHDLRALPLEQRKQLLETSLPAASAPGRVRLSEHFIGDAAAFLAQACEHGLEGVISKRRDSPYRSARTRDWRKIKCTRRQEVVVGGYTPARSGPRAIGALLVGVYEGTGDASEPKLSLSLKYVGKVGTGFDHDEAARLFKILSARAIPRSPFAGKLPGDVARSRFVRPELVVEVRFSEWTRDGRMRHPVYEAIREDKRPEEVEREVAAPATPSGAVQVLGVTLSNPRRVLFPDDGITKRDLAEYYEEVAGWIVPHVADRPLSLVRCPNGVGRPCFFQRHLRHDLPESIETLDLEDRDDDEAYLYLHDARGLVALAQMGALELHVWGATASAPDSPDRMVLDLDPGEGVAWDAVKVAARHLRDRLRQLDLDSFLKTTGGKGLHVVVPLAAGRQDWSTVKRFARGLADELVRAAPEHYIATASKARRRGKIYVDYLRNDRAASSIAPYSPRARPGAPVSVPIRWSELAGLESSQVYTLNNVVARLAALRGDPWRAIFKMGARQALTNALMREIAPSR